MKLKKLLVLVLALALCLPIFTACEPEPVHIPPPPDDPVTVVLLGNSVTVSYEADLSHEDFSSASTALDMLDCLRQKAGLTYNGDDSPFGFYLTRIGHLSPASNEFIEIFTSVAKDFDVSVYARTFEYNGTSLTTAGKGVSDLSVPNGAVILFTVTQF